MSLKTLLLAISVIGAAATPYAQAQHSHPRVQSGRAAVLVTGIGARSHPVSTSIPDAQKFFDQGLAFVYAFNHEEAEASFRKSGELDPQLAMAFWGIALANGPNYNIPEIDSHSMKTAYDAIQQALTLSGRARPKEQAYIRALSKRYSLDFNAVPKQLGRNYSNAMREVHRLYPDDDDAAVLYAESLMDLNPWQLWDKNGAPATDTGEILKALEMVLNRTPDHVGANHLYIHTLEASRNPEKALSSARRIAELAPEAGHLVHMPSHVYIRTGDFHAAAESNRHAAEADRRYIAKAGATGLYPVMYYNHNLHFLTFAHMMQGRQSDAMKAAQEAKESALPSARDYPMLESLVALPLLVSIRFNRWEEILTMPKPDGTLPMQSAFWRFARGMAHAATGKLPEAEEDLRLTALFINAAPPESRLGLNRLTDILKLNELVLSGRIHMTRKDYAKAIEDYRQAVKLQDSLVYDEPEPYFYSVRESLGAALLRSGSSAEAVAVFREDLQHTRGNGRSLFGLWQSLLAQKKTAEAKKIESQFRTAWKHADTELTLEGL